MLDLSIVIPVYNEEENLPLLWPELRGVLESLGHAFEVVFVDDGSRDRSAEIIRELREQDPRVRLVRLKANAGETAATDAGFKTARGRHVVVMDADLQNDPHDIPAMLGHLDQWDAVTGWRVNRGDGDSVLRRVSSRIANRLRNALSDETIQDSGCTFRAFRRECLADLVLYKGFHRFIPTLLKMRGFRVLEVPLTRDWRHDVPGLLRAIEVGSEIGPEHIAIGKLHEEWYEIGPATTRFLNKAKKEGRPIEKGKAK